MVVLISLWIPATTSGKVPHLSCLILLCKVKAMLTVNGCLTRMLCRLIQSYVARKVMVVLRINP